MSIKTIILQIYLSIFIILISITIVICSFIFSVVGLFLLGIVLFIYAVISIKDDLYRLKTYRALQKQYNDYAQERNINHGETRYK